MITYTYIYTLEDKFGNIRYVGKTDNIEKRIRLHKCDSKNNRTYLHKWLKSIDLDFKLVVVDEVDKSGWQFWEQFYINLFKSWGFRLVNLTKGGGGGAMTGKKHSEEAKKKMSAWQMGDGNHRFGTTCIHSEDTIKKCSAAKKEQWKNGVYSSDEYKQKMRDVRIGKPLAMLRKSIKCNETGQTFEGISQASIFLKGDVSASGNITSQLKGKLKTAYGHTFSYV